MTFFFSLQPLSANHYEQAKPSLQQFLRSSLHFINFDFVLVSTIVAHKLSQTAVNLFEKYSLVLRLLIVAYRIILYVEVFIVTYVAFYFVGAWR